MGCGGMLALLVSVSETRCSETHTSHLHANTSTSINI